MGWFLGLGIAGVVLLLLALVLDGVLEGLFDGVGVPDGQFDGLLSLPVIAGFVSMLGFGGAIAMGATGVGPVGATVIGTRAGGPGGGGLGGGDAVPDSRVRTPRGALSLRAPVLVKQAEADAQRSRLTGEGEKAHRAALADAVRIEGEAEAAAIGAKGAAEAEAMRKKADAFAQYGDAAVLQMLVEVLPHVVAKASEPLSAIDKMTVISTDGASQLSRTVADNVAQGVELLGSTTGVDLAELLKNLTQRTGGAQPAAGASAEANGKIEITG